MFEADGEAGSGMLPEDEHYDNLGEIWRSVGIDPAQDLTITELAMVCQHIGMDMTHEELEQLFSRLDGDGDGRITYEEFHEGLFQHGLSSSSQVLPDEPLPKTPTVAGSHRSRASLPNTPTSNPRPSRRLSRGLTPVRFHDDSHRPLTPALTPSGRGSGLFSAIDLDQTGLCSTEGIVEHWDTLGVSEGEEILLNLGFNSQSKISLSELSFLLTQEIASAADQSSTFQAAFLSYQQELQHTRMLVEQTTAEKNKLRSDMMAANSRNEILVKEADERHIRLEQSMEAKMASLEQKYQGEIRTLQSALEEERDSQASQSSKLRQRLEDRIEGLKHEEMRVKQNLILSQKETERLERDVGELMEQLDEAQTLNVQLRRDLQAANDLHQAVMDGQFPDDWQGSSQGRQQQLQVDNKALRDRVDELTAEVERLKHEVMSARRSSTHGVRPLESPTGSPSNKRRRHVGTDYLTSEESMDDGPRSLSPVQETMSDAKLLGLEKELDRCRGELELAKQLFEDERKDIEQVFKMEIVGIEEGHDRDKQQLLQSFSREKERLTEELVSTHQGALAELERTLQNDFAAAKQEMILKYESEKNYMEHQHASERARLELRLEDAMAKRGNSNVGLEEMAIEKAALQDRFLKEKMHLEEVHAKEKSDIFKDVEAERNELIGQYKEEIEELKERITGLRERLEAADAKVIEGQTRLREAETKLRETETKLREAIQELNAADMKVAESSRKAEQTESKLRDMEGKLRETVAKLGESEAKLTGLVTGQPGREQELRSQLTRELRDRLRQELEAEKEEGFVAQIQKIRSAFEEEKRLLQSQTENLRRSESQLMESCEKLRTDSADLQNSNKLLVADTKKMAAEVDKTKIELSQQVTMYKTRCEELQALNSAEQSHKNSYMSAEEEKTRLQKKVEELQSKNSELRVFRGQYTEAVAMKEALEGRVRSAESSLRELTESATALTKAQSATGSLLEDKAKLESELGVTRERLEETKRRLEQETGEKTRLLGELDTSRVKLAEVNKSLEDVKAERPAENPESLGQRGAGLSLEQLTELQTQLREALGRASQSEKHLKEVQQETALTLLNTEGIHRHQLEVVETKVGQLTSKLAAATRGLEETTTKYKQQCEESVRLGLQLKDQTSRNAQLSEALYLTEIRQKQAEARYLTMAERCQAFKDMAYKVARAGVGR